jgi:hypothetical protein
MPITVNKVDVWVAEIPDEAGALDELLGALAEAGANLECVIGRRRHDRPNRGQVFITPVKGAKAQKAARASGLAPAKGMVTLRVETPQKAGIGHKIMQAVADAGVNVRGISAASIGTKAVAYIGFDSSRDADKAMKVIKAAGK